MNFDQTYEPELLKFKCKFIGKEFSTLTWKFPTWSEIFHSTFPPKKLLIVYGK